MYIIVFLVIGIFGCLDQQLVNGDEENFRYLEYEGLNLKTTFHVDQKFTGMYTGEKTGYLLLKSDGTGIYQYDYHGFMDTGCEAGKIEMAWGFLIDEKGEVARTKRPYGYSYPIIYCSTGNGSFRDCTRVSMVDYILEYDDGTLTISSSDDWVKTE